DGLSGEWCRGGPGDKRACGGRRQQAPRVGLRVAFGAGALLLRVELEAARLRAAGAAGRGAAGGRWTASISARGRWNAGDEADGLAGASGLRCGGRVANLP